MRVRSEAAVHPQKKQEKTLDKTSSLCYHFRMETNTSKALSALTEYSSLERDFFVLDEDNHEKIVQHAHYMSAIIDAYDTIVNNPSLMVAEPPLSIKDATMSDDELKNVILQSFDGKRDGINTFVEKLSCIRNEKTFDDFFNKFLIIVDLMFEDLGEPIREQFIVLLNNLLKTTDYYFKKIDELIKDRYDEYHDGLIVLSEFIFSKLKKDFKEFKNTIKKLDTEIDVFYDFNEMEGRSYIINDLRGIYLKSREIIGLCTR